MQLSKHFKLEEFEKKIEILVDGKPENEKWENFNF